MKILQVDLINFVPKLLVTLLILVIKFYAHVSSFRESMVKKEGEPDAYGAEGNRYGVHTGPGVSGSGELGLHLCHHRISGS